MPSNKNKQPKETQLNIFQISGLKNHSAIKIKPMGVVSIPEGGRLQDSLLQKYNIVDNVVGEIYVCNVTGMFLMKTKKLPVFYINVILEKPLNKILLFRIFLYFTINDDTIKTSDQLFNNKINGEFSLELLIDHNTTELERIEKYLGADKMTNKLMEFTQNDDMKILIESLVAAENKKLEEIFMKEFGNVTPPKVTISLKDYLNDSEEETQ